MICNFKERMFQVVKDGDLLQIGNLKVRALSTPCHTSTHICYFVEDESQVQKAVFTGDTLFIAGCGRFFEGTANQMHTALNYKLAKLPDETVILSFSIIFHLQNFRVFTVVMNILLLI